MISHSQSFRAQNFCPIPVGDGVLDVPELSRARNCYTNGAAVLSLLFLFSYLLFLVSFLFSLSSLSEHIFAHSLHIVRTM